MLRTTHWCAGCEALIEPPFFFEDELVDIRDNQRYTVTVLIFPTKGEAAWGTMVEFCPWCGMKVGSPHTSFNLNTAGLDAKQEYLEYRKRFVKQSRPGIPMSEGAWAEAKAAYEQTEMLLPHAKPEHRDSLYKNKQELRDLLCLGVLLKMMPKADENETAEEYVKRLRQAWRGETPNFDENVGESPQI